METSIKLSNKEKSVDLLKSLETREPLPISYINPKKYIQHNLQVEDGVAGLQKFMGYLPEGVKVNVVRAFEDGDFVFTHANYNFGGPVTGFDVFRFENGKAVEHWDNLQPTQPANPSGRTMIDGATEVTDLDKTEANKKLVRNFVEDILVNGKMEKLAGYFHGDDYIQHNPWFPDTLSGFVATITEMSKQGMTLQYSAVHKVLGQGNFVLVMGEGHLSGVHSSFYDLFRIENGKIAEHWDVIEEIPAAATHQNRNGKF